MCAAAHWCVSQPAEQLLCNTSGDGERGSVFIHVACITGETAACRGWKWMVWSGWLVASLYFLTVKQLSNCKWFLLTSFSVNTHQEWTQTVLLSQSSFFLQSLDLLLQIPCHPGLFQPDLADSGPWTWACAVWKERRADNLHIDHLTVWVEGSIQQELIILLLHHPQILLTSVVLRLYPELIEQLKHLF